MKKILLFLLLLIGSLSFFACGKTFKVSLSEGIRTEQEQNLEQVKKGTELKLIIEVPEEKEIATFTVDEVDRLSEVKENTFILKVEKNHEVKVNFQDSVTKFYLALPAEVSANWADLSQIPINASVELTITIPSGKEIEKFLVNNHNKIDELTTDHKYVFKMLENTNVMVTFKEPIDDSINYKVELPEKVVVQGKHDLNKVAKNTTLTLKIEVPKEKIVKSFQVNDVEMKDLITLDNTFSLTVDQDIIIKIEFDEIPSFSITTNVVPASLKNNIKISGATNLSKVLEGTKLTVTVENVLGYSISLVTLDDLFQPLDSSNKFSFIVSKTHEIKVEYEQVEKVKVTTTITPGQESRVKITGLDSESKVYIGQTITLAITLDGELKAAIYYSANYEYFEKTDQIEIEVDDAMDIQITISEVYKVATKFKKPEYKDFLGINYGNYIYRYYEQDPYSEIIISKKGEMTDILYDKISTNFPVGKKLVYKIKGETQQHIIAEQTEFVHVDKETEIEIDVLDLEKKTITLNVDPAYKDNVKIEGLDANSKALEEDKIKITLTHPTGKVGRISLDGVLFNLNYKSQCEFYVSKDHVIDINYDDATDIEIELYVEPSTYQSNVKVIGLDSNNKAKEGTFIELEITPPNGYAYNFNDINGIIFSSMSKQKIEYFVESNRNNVSVLFFEYKEFSFKPDAPKDKEYAKYITIEQDYYHDNFYLLEKIVDGSYKVFCPKDSFVFGITLSDDFPNNKGITIKYNGKYRINVYTSGACFLSDIPNGCEVTYEIIDMG